MFPRIALKCGQNLQLFKLDSERKPLYVAGVPADNFFSGWSIMGKSYLQLART